MSRALKNIKFGIFFFLCFLQKVGAQDLFEELVKIEIVADQELKDLWDSLDDINHPSYQDYQAIECYLQYGRRAYLDDYLKYVKYNGLLEDDLVKQMKLLGIKDLVSRSNLQIKDPLRSFGLKSRLLQQIKFVNPSDEQMPSFQVIPINCEKENLQRCIVIYSSYNLDPLYNVPYTSRVAHVISELTELGFAGHLVAWQGGYPLAESGGMKLSHVPYSFKVLALLAAEKMGYKSALWLDTAIHPQTDLSAIFDVIECKGYYTLRSGIQLDYDDNLGLLPITTRESWKIGYEQLKEIDHIIAGIIGVNLQDHKGRELLKEWYTLTAELFPAMSLYPEEFLISLACWRLGLHPIDHIGYQMDVKSVKPYQPGLKQKPFYHDKS